MGEKQSQQGIVRQKPEDKELERKTTELAGLEAELAEQELALATLRAEIATFERRYLGTVGRRYAELDQLEVQIAESLARQNSKDEYAWEQANAARARAHESATEVGGIEEGIAPQDFRPSEDLKKAYRDAAKALHPDLATDDGERSRRQQVMAEVNAAYEDGDEERIRAILREWESSPERVEGEGPGAELVRVIRKIAQVTARLRALKTQIEALRHGELSQLKSKVEDAAREGRDLLDEMVQQLDARIAEARSRLMEAR